MRRFDEKRKEWKHTHKHTVTLPANRWPLICDVQLINFALEKIYYFDVFSCVFVCVFGACHKQHDTYHGLGDAKRRRPCTLPRFKMHCQEGKTNDFNFGGLCFRFFFPPPFPANGWANEYVSFSWHWHLALFLTWPIMLATRVIQIFPSVH